MAHIEDIRNYITLGEKEISNVEASDFPGTYPNYDDKWSKSKFQKGFSINISKIEDQNMEFDMVGIDASLANAFRRILLSEVPSMAIDCIKIINNTSIIFDEMLAHRIGLVPILADPRLYEYKPEEDSEPSGEDSILFKLHVKCTKNPNAPKGCLDSTEAYLNSRVTTKDFIWTPIGNQTFLNDSEKPRPVDDDILIAKLIPGQEIEALLYCFKGIGKTHAKFSPVATAFYRLLPEIKLTRRVTGEDAILLQSCFNEGVIVIDEIDGEQVAKVGDSRKDALSRNIFRHDHLKDCVSMKLVRNHFIFSVESTGILPPDVLVTEAIKIMQKKCTTFLNGLQDI